MHRLYLQAVNKIVTAVGRIEKYKFWISQSWKLKSKVTATGNFMKMVHHLTSCVTSCISWRIYYQIADEVAAAGTIKRIADIVE